MILYLFDIDGTLVRCGGAGARAFEDTLLEHFAIDAARHDVKFGGKTDPAILDEFLVSHRGAPAQDDERARFLTAYLDRLDATLAGGVRVLPRAHDVLVALAARGDCVLAVATGNVRRGAEIKLRHAGLDGHFDLVAHGGYGCDSAVRAELVARAIVRGKERGAVDAVVVVGDTIHDISAARANGATVVAVTTGSDHRDALAHADVVLDELGPLLDWHAQRFAS